MLLAVDAGNTNITFGIFEQEELKTTFHITAKAPRTADEYGILLCELMRNRNTAGEAEAAIVASVVPGAMYSLTNGIRNYLGVSPVIVGTGTKTGLRIMAANPKEIGAERIADAVAAYELYGGPVIVIDFDTATTYDLVLADGSFAAGVTCPGLGISANALWNGTAKLPEIEIKKPESILAKETVSSMQAGLVYGCIGQTEYIVKKLKEEAGLVEAKVVATGEFGAIIAKETAAIHVYDPVLTLKGLRLIYEKHTAGRDGKLRK